METTTINSRTLCCKWLIGLALAVFFLFNLQRVEAQDMGVTTLVTPYSTVCAGTNQTVNVTIKNYDTQTIDYTVNSVTITVNITGASTQTFSTTISSGTLTAGATQNVTIATTANLSVSGTHVFNANTTFTGDINSSNDAMPISNVFVNPIPLATATPSSQTICSGTSPSIVLSSNIVGTTFSWTVVQNGVSGGSNFSLITSQILTTTGPNIGTAVYTITPSANGCIGIPITVTITVKPNPVPIVTSASQSICSGTTTGISLTSNVGGTTFSYTANQTDVTGATGGTGATIVQILAVTNTVAGAVVYTITPLANGCVGNTINNTVTVNPMDDASFSYPSATYCQTGIDPASIITGLQGGTFSSIPVGLAINASTGLISLATSVLGSYTITYTTNGNCPNTSSVIITITNAPDANFSYSGSHFCQNANNPFPTFGSGSSAGIFSATPSGLVFVNINSGEIDLLTSTTGTYTVTNTIPANGGCAIASAVTSVTINSTDVSFAYSLATYCQAGTNPIATITGVAGGLFSAIPIGLSIDASTGAINLATSSLGTYTVLYSINGLCQNSGSVNITITNVPPDANFSYSDSLFCKNVSNPSPIYGTGAAAGVFSASPAGLVFANTNTGVINLYASAIGSYTVTNTIPASGNCIATSATTTVHIINSCGISGYIFKDNNGNCIMDPGDQRVENIPVNLYDNNNNFMGQRHSLSNGSYQFSAPLGTYALKIDTTTLPFTTQCIYPGIDSIVTLTSGNSGATNINFEIACKPGFDVGGEGVFAGGSIFPGVQHQLGVCAGNMSHWYNLNCTAAISGQVQVTVTGPVTYNGSTFWALTPSVSGNVFTYTIADFDSINNHQDFRLKFTTNTSAQAGDQICVNVLVTPTTGDNDLSNNTYQFCYIIGNSYDPNMKEVYPVNVVPGFQDWFTYTIHFQNTGNASAMNIRLADTLDANLDLGTFELIDYSDTTEVLLDNNFLTFNFANIMLPDSTSDPEGSKGFVQYRVKSKANLPAGTQVKNTAFIYFDYNAPIVTNTTINEFVEPASISEIKSSETLSVYPNPGNGKFKIQMDNGQLSMDNYQLSIYNVLGEKIFQSEIKNLKTEIDISHQPNGIYIIRVNDGIQSLNQRLIKQ
ncbi:MAG: PKD-like domain-containing protein [Bacteroidota bacterium]